MKYETEQKILSTKIYFEGLRDGVYKYAHWKDGVQYVGTVGRTLKEAIQDIADEEEYEITLIKRNSNEHS